MHDVRMRALDAPVLARAPPRDRFEQPILFAFLALLGICKGQNSPYNSQRPGRERGQDDHLQHAIWDMHLFWWSFLG